MKSTKDIYDECASQYDCHPYCMLDSLGSVLEIAALKYFFEKQNIQLTNKRVLDIGTGTGRNAEIFLDRFKARVFASDCSKGMVRQLKEKRHSLTAIVEDALNLAWKENGFDVVNSSWTINHIKNYKNAIKEMARVSKKRGFVVITVVNPPQKSECKKDEHGNYVYKTSLFNNSDGKPVYMWLYQRDKDEYVNAMKDAGLKILEISDKNLEELERRGFVDARDAKRFDKSSRNVRVNLMVFAKKP